MEGTILGNRYEIIEKIGTGGMAVVYKARCQLLNRYVAVKILKPEHVNDDDFVKRFRVEAQSAASLSHPNIVSIYDVGREGDIHYIVMEYINGITLTQYIQKKGRLQWREAVKIAIQITSAIENAHKHFIVHRDIKPHNIMLTNDGNAKVTDFGIARAANSSTITMTGSTMGSVHYLSPEQARGGYVDEKSDLYSIGVVLYEMVTGNPPFNGDSPVNIAIKHIQNHAKPPFEVNSSIPKGLSDIIMNAMEKNQRDRYPNAASMLTDLYKVLKDPYGNFKSLNPKDRSSTIRMDAITEHDLIKREESDIQKKIGQKKRRRDRTIFAALLMSVVIIAAFTYMGYKFILPKIIEPVKEFTVEDYVGQSFDKASDELGKYNIKILDKREYNDDTEAGIIMQQSVIPGEKFKIDGYNVIEFITSRGPNEIEVPDVTDIDYRDAEGKLKNLGLTVELYEENDDTCPSGFVIKTEPEAGIKLRPMDTIKVFRSVGPEIKDTTVPDMVGMTLQQASEALAEAKLTIGSLYPEDEIDDTLTIIKHYPEAGETVAEDTGVSLHFGTGEGDQNGDEIQTVMRQKSLILYDPQNYGEDISVAIYIRYSNSTNEEFIEFTKGTVKKNKFPITFEVPVPVNGYTDVNVTLDGKDYARAKVNYSN